jgi:hypothetical protein
VGYSALSKATHLWVTQVGTKSTLFNTKTSCLCGFSVLKKFSMWLLLVPAGSLASRTYGQFCM